MRTHELYGSGYVLDESGRVWSPHKNAYLKLSTNSNGYPFCIIYINGEAKNILVHREVWKSFNNSSPIGGIKFIDGNKMNAELDNLIPAHPGWQYVEFVKQGISITKIAGYYKLPKKSISEIVSLLIPGGIRELRKQYPLNKSVDIHAFNKEFSQAAN